MNSRPLPYQGSALPLSYTGVVGAEDEVRTRDPQLGRLMLYRLSYFRNSRFFLVISSLDFASSVGHYQEVTPSILTRPPRNPSKTNFDFVRGKFHLSKQKPDRFGSRGLFCGRRWIRTTEGINQQIYSLPHLATLVFSLFSFVKTNFEMSYF